MKTYYENYNLDDDEFIPLCDVDFDHLDDNESLCDGDLDQYIGKTL